MQLLVEFVRGDIGPLSGSLVLANSSRIEATISDLKGIILEDGVTVVTEPVAILSSARNVPAARAFVDFIMSRDGQALAASQGMFPARGDVQPPAGFPALSSVRMLQADIPAILAAGEADKRRFADLFGR